MSGYSYSEIIKMQNDAMRRVEGMKQSADKVIMHANEELKSDGRKDSPHKPDKPLRVPMSDDYIRDLKAYAERATLSPYDSEKRDTTRQSNLNSLTSRAMDIPKTIKNVLSDLNIDKDRSLLLSLILLLAEEQSDEFLIIALLYMMI